MHSLRTSCLTCNVFQPSIQLNVTETNILMICQIVNKMDARKHTKSFSVRLKTTTIHKTIGGNSGCVYPHQQTVPLTRFNKIYHPSQRPRWQVDKEAIVYRESNNVHLLITRPPEICVNLVFKHIHAASSYTICSIPICSIPLLSSVRTSASRCPIYIDPLLILPHVL